MKLYRFYLDDNALAREILDVEEKPKTYTIIGCDCGGRESPRKILGRWIVARECICLRMTEKKPWMSSWITILMRSADMTSIMSSSPGDFGKYLIF